MAIVANLHNAEPSGVLNLLQTNSVDYVVAVDDMVRRLGHRTENDIRLITEAASIAPVYYALGNHELACNLAYFRSLE